MAELLSHVLHAFVLFTVLSWWVGWLTRRWVAVGMVGAILPDLNRIDMLVDGDTIEAVIGIPWGWGGLHTVGGVLLLAAIGAVLFSDRHEQLRAFGLLTGGAVLHLVVDSLKLWADGFAGAYWYPLTWYRPPTPGLYVSADRWVTVASVALAVVVFAADRWYRNRASQRT